MNVKLSKEKVRNLINQYYREVYGIEGKTSIQVSKDYVGYGMGEHTESYPYFRGIEVNITGKEKIKEKENERYKRFKI